MLQQSKASALLEGLGEDDDGEDESEDDDYVGGESSRYSRLCMCIYTL